MLLFGFYQFESFLNFSRQKVQKSTSDALIVLHIL